MKGRKCEENLYFHIETALFKDDLETPEEYLVEQAKRIYDKFFAETAQYQLNIDSDIMRAVHNLVANNQITRSIFDDAQRAAFKIMETACIAGFQQSQQPATATPKKHAPKLIKNIFKKKATESREKTYSIVQITKFFSLRTRT